MNKRPYIYLPIFFALVLILGIFLGTLLIPSLSSYSGLFSSNQTNNDKLHDVINYVQENYVDSTSGGELEKNAINGLLQSLDPHSVYISAEDFNNANDPLKGMFDGIGVQFRIIRDTITVLNVVSGGPSEKEGLLGGDRIVQIDGKNVAKIKVTNEDVMKRLKGPKGTKVKVCIYRKGNKELIYKTITRGVIPTNSIDIAFMASKDIGYIKLSKFSGTTTNEFINTSQSLKRQGMKKLIFDLRGNGGGYLDAAVDLADQFLPGKKLIVYTEGYHRKKMNYYATGKGELENTELVIIIDELSASASEILAGAIQDNDRGIIIGRRSFGKGLVQEQVQLPDRSAVRLTVARYHTPTGRCIQRPYTSNVDEYYAEFYKQFMKDESYQDSINFVDTLRYVTHGGKVVYGGGGIMPDIYIPAKSEYPSLFYKQLLLKNLIYNFSFDYADKNRHQLLTYGNANGYIKNFQLSLSILNDFIDYAAKNGVKAKPEDIKVSEKLISAQLKGYIGRNIYDDPAFYPVILPEDKNFQKALEVLQGSK